MRYYKFIIIINFVQDTIVFIEKPRFIAILSDYHDAMDLFDYTNKLIYKNIFKLEPGCYLNFNISNEFEKNSIIIMSLFLLINYYIQFFEIV